MLNPFQSVSSSFRVGVGKDGVTKKKKSMFRSLSDVDTRPHLSMKLKMVLGMTYPAGNCISVNPVTGVCAYTASNAVVLFDTINARQIGYMKDSKKPIGTIRFSSDGKLLVTGGRGHRPPVCVLDVAHRSCLAMIYGHEYGIKCVAFSPRVDKIVSVGNIFDGFIFIWAWPQKVKLASNRFAEEICDLSFSPDNNFFVTCGIHHVKFWYPERVDVINKKIGLGNLEDTVLYGRPAVLGSIKMTTFVGVACGTLRTSSYVYTINSTGHIALLSSSMRDIIKMQSMCSSPFSSLSVHDDILIVATKDGHVFICNALSLEVISSLAPSAVHCCVNASNRGGYQANDARINTFICHDHVHNILSVFSTGGKLTIWDTANPYNIVKRLYIYNHCCGITGSDILPMESRPEKKREVLVTISADATIRLWSLDATKTICCDGVTIMSTDLASTWETSDDVDFPGYDKDGSDHGDLLTACKVCDEFIVTGDNQGNVVAYKMSDLQVVATAKHHCRGVACMDIFVSKQSDKKFLLSGGRDRKIILYDLNDKLNVLCISNIHSATITFLKMFEKDAHIILLSCALDRSVVLSTCSQAMSPKLCVRFNRFLPSSTMDCVFHERENTFVFGTVSGEICVFCMDTLNPIRSFSSSASLNARVDKLALDSKSNLLLAACSDRMINAINYSDGKLLAITCSTFVSGLYFSVNKRCFISTSTDGCIFVWGLSSRPSQKPLARSSSLELQNFAKKDSSAHRCVSRLDSVASSLISS